MRNEVDDYQSDVRFGEWLKKQREAKGLSLEKAAQAAEVEAGRLKSLEIGYAERGITRSEAVRLAATYKLSLEDLLTRAENS